MLIAKHLGRNARAKSLQQIEFKTGASGSNRQLRQRPARADGFIEHTVQFRAKVQFAHNGYEGARRLVAQAAGVINVTGLLITVRLEQN